MQRTRILLAAALSLVAAGCSCGDGGVTMLDGDLPDGSTDGASLDALVADGATTSGCGDGVRDRDTEICDDGNAVGGDGCSADCASDESCGNGIADGAAGEICDDGNTTDGDTCRGDCLSDYQCGNGVVDTIASGGSTDEVCDDGNTANGDGCSAACDSDESCGNSIVDLGEACDDGNTSGGDACSADCLTSMLCGNGSIDAPEECDDGNMADADGCSAGCLVERCGNGRVDAGEACDDGNMIDTDGCRNDCAFTCGSDADCADGDACNGAETCTSPGTATSACAAATSPAADGTACGSMLICLMGGCVTSACGDGFRDMGRGEACDDGNTMSGDGCDNDCTFTCSVNADCSDGNGCNGTEVCMMAGTTSSRCAPGTPRADGTACGGGRICRAGACVTPGCGDGVRSGTEQCDDANMVSGDGCDADCTWTCAGAADCTDGNACNGNEACAMPSTLMSRCTAGTPPAMGSSCGAGVICVAGSCVAARCGDSFVTAPEQCDDGNTASADGCDSDCTWTCAGAADCTDGNSCNGNETCTMPSTLMSRCVAGTPPAQGALCDRDMMPATRDICRMMTCVASRCGDGFTDIGATPSEQCDDGNTANGDGCSSACQNETAVPPTGFRVTALRLISPRITANIPLGGCQDITDNCPSIFGTCVSDGVNTLLQNAINPTTTANGTYSLHLVDVFRPLAPASARTATELHLNAECMQAPTPDSCGPDAAMPDVVMSFANNQSAGNCFTPVAADVNTRAGTPAAYNPTANTVGPPCFVTDETTLTVTLSGIAIPLERARVSATYSGAPPNRLVSGIVTGFLSDRAAADILLPATLPDPIGNTPLYTHLQAANRSTMNSAGTTVADGCDVGGGTDEDDGDMNGTTRGFWFFLNFTGEVITWTGT